MIRITHFNKGTQKESISIEFKSYKNQENTKINKNKNKDNTKINQNKNKKTTKTTK